MLSKLLKSLKTLRVRIIAIVALSWLMPMLLLGVYMSSVFVDGLRLKTAQALQAGVTRSQDLTVREIERVLKKSKDITYDEVIYNTLSSYHAGEIDYESFYTTARSYWQRMFQREKGMPFTAFFPVNEPWKMIHTADDVGLVTEFNEEALPYILRLANTLDTRSRFAYVNDRLYLVRNLFNRRLERFGIVVIGLDENALFSSLLDKSSLWQGQADIVLDEYRHIANSDFPFEEEAKDIDLWELNGDIYYRQKTKTSDYLLTYRVRLDASIVYGQLDRYNNLLLALILMLIPFAAIVVSFVHCKMTKPLTDLSKASLRLASGELGITVPSGGIDEIGKLGESFNTMSLQIQQLIEQSYLEELALRDARISALQSRINPHFMNNALELMNWQARLDGAEAVERMIEALSILINAALDRTDERVVPLSAELKVADAYFFFIKQRFGNRVHIEKSYNDALLDRQVPRLIIQVLLENAIEHGIAPAGGGTVRLHIYMEEELLFVDVYNNGKLLNHDELEKINLLLKDENRTAHSSHLGIRNVNLRLKLIYHEKAGLEILNADGGDTLARIHIPLI